MCPEHFLSDGAARVFLKGRVALITGSTTGIGAAIAGRMAEAGCDTVLHGLGNAQEIERDRLSLEERAGVRVLHFSHDLSSASSSRRLIQDIEQAVGPIDILVNNAGIQYMAAIEEFPTAQWDALLAINLSAPFHLCASVLGSMRMRRFGRIINIASAHGLVGSAQKSAYVASKHGLVGLTKVIALEAAESGVTCNAICPGWVRTPLFERQMAEIARTQNVGEEEASRELLREKHPTRRFTEACHIAEMALFLCTPAADNLSGAVIPMDGGWTAQ